MALGGSPMLLGCEGFRLFLLLGWLPMYSEDLKTGLSGRPFPQYLNAQWGPAVESSGDMRGCALGGLRTES